MQFIKEFYWFGIKQAYACLFGGFLLAMMIITGYWYPLESLHRYDFLFLAAIVFQLALLAFKLAPPQRSASYRGVPPGRHRDGAI